MVDCTVAGVARNCVAELGAIEAPQSTRFWRYATGYLHSLYTAAEHSISPLQQQATACPWHPAAATDERIERLPVMLQAVARCGWFISCLGLSDMPIPTPIAYFPPQSTRFWRFSGFFALRGPRHRNGSLNGLIGMGSAPADCR